MNRASSGYFSDEELFDLAEEIEVTHLSTNENSKRETSALNIETQSESSVEIYRVLKDLRKDILYKVLESEKALQRELAKRLSFITQKRKEIYKERFTLLTKSTEQKIASERNHWQLFSIGDGSSFNSVDIVEIQQKMKELEGDLKRSELRYNIGRDLSLGHKNNDKKCMSIKLSNEQYIDSLEKNLRRNNLETKANDLKIKIQDHHKLLKEYKVTRKREKRMNNDAADKLKLPKLKGKKMKKSRKTSIKEVDKSDVSRPYTFSYFPDLSAEDETKQTLFSRRPIISRGHFRK